jgi:hypothetical protein
MTTRLVNDPNQMRCLASLFDMYAQIVQDEALKIGASSQDIDTMGQINQACRNIVKTLHGVRDGLIRDADIYGQQEQAFQQTIGS